MENLRDAETAASAAKRDVDERAGVARRMERRVAAAMRQVDDWLDSLGLGSYAPAFASNGIDFTVLPALTDKDLEKLGLLLGHRRKLLRAIAALDTGVRETPKRAAKLCSSRRASGCRAPVTMSCSS